MPVILFINLKGGVAKTANSVAIGECLACHGYKTLVIDGDHQCAASELTLGSSVSERADGKRKTLHDLLAGMLDDEFEMETVSQYVFPRASDIGGGLKNLSALPCSLRIDDFQTNVLRARKEYGSEDLTKILRCRRGALNHYLNTHYDYTIIDCPPSVPIQVRFLLGTADTFIVPCVPDRLSVRGALYLLDRIRRLGYKRHGLGTLWSLYKGNSTTHKAIMSRAEARESPYDALPPSFSTHIKHTEAFIKTIERRDQPQTFKKKYETLAKSYEGVCEEIRQRLRRGRKVRAK